MGKGWKQRQAQRRWLPWTLEMWTWPLEMSWSRLLVLRCCLHWIVVRRTLILRQYHLLFGVSSVPLCQTGQAGVGQQYNFTSRPCLSDAANENGLADCHGHG